MKPLISSYIIKSLAAMPCARPSLICPNNVGPVTASNTVSLNIGFGIGHVVIATGKDMSMKTRPTNAGLNGLLPKPPNDILPMPIATIEPTIIIHAGMLDGKLNANKIPVIIADPTAMVQGPLIRNFWISHSVKTQAILI